MDILAKILKEKRINHKLTQRDIAKILKINQVTYHGYESGKHEPSLGILIKIADYYETSLDYLVGRYLQ